MGKTSKPRWIDAAPWLVKWRVIRRDIDGNGEHWRGVHFASKRAAMFYVRKEDLTEKYPDYTFTVEPVFFQDVDYEPV
jgi:hypothetical protein